MLIADSVKREFLDNAHYDIGCAFLGEYAKLNDIVITGGSGFNPFVFSEGELKTQQFTLTCIVTAEQDGLLQKLYAATMHPGYVDQRFPVQVSWGHISARHHRSCYLKSYAPPSQISFRDASILEVTLVLRPI